MPVLERRRRDDPRREATEAAFLSAARELLDEGVPFADVSIARIAERAERKRSAFYAHFEDRRELLMRLVVGFADDLRDAIVPFTSPDSGRADVHASVTGVLTVFRAHEGSLRAIVEAAAYDQVVAEYWTDLVGRFVTIAEGRLAAAGIEDPAATAFALTWMTERAAVRQLTTDTGLSDAALVDSLTGVWWRSLA